MIDLFNTMTAFDKKIQLWKTNIEKNNFQLFPHLQMLTNSLTIKKDIMLHLKNITDQITYYFSSDLSLYSKLICNPFTFSIDQLPDHRQENFCELICDDEQK